MEYRPWQLRFLEWLGTRPTGSLVNLCGGPWGKTTLAKMNQDSTISYYSSLEQWDQIQADLEKDKKVVLVSILPRSVENLSIDTYEIDE